MQNNYTLFYSDKKKEDIFLIKSMFNNSRKLGLIWIQKDFKDSLDIVQSELENGVSQIIFFGLEIGWDKLIREIRNKYNNIQIKVICNTADSLLYYDYERDNFFNLLELSKENIINNIGFLKKGQYEVYKNLGYKCSYLLENFISENHMGAEHDNNNLINIGIYPLNYTWDKNIFNQLSIGKFIDNSVINYNAIDSRMQDFADTFKINSNPQNINEDNMFELISKNNINIACSFTEYFHTIFFISMELGTPCITGNTIDILPDNLKEYLIVNSEDSPKEISDKIIKCLENKEKILSLYKEWKQIYNEESKKSIAEFLEEINIE